MSVFMSQVGSILPSIMLVLFLLAFIVITVLTYLPSQKNKLEEHAQIPFKESQNVSEK